MSGNDLKKSILAPINDLECPRSDNTRYICLVSENGFTYSHTVSLGVDEI